jgi:hypothetical protein
MDKSQHLIVDDLRGGRNGTDAPGKLLPNQCVDAVDIDWYQATFARKRNGSTALSTAFSSGGPFTGKLSSLFRHVPTTDATAAEFWGIDDALVTGRLAGAVTWTAPTLKDAWTGNGWDVSFATLNGKLFIGGKTAQSRLHVWDGSTVRRVGLPTPAAPTVANTAGGGAYPATAGFWRVRWVQLVSAVTTIRSEPSPSTAFTPSGTNVGVTVTQPTVAGEAETHWEVEFSLDNTTFFVVYGASGGVAAQAIATTTAPVTAVPTALVGLGVSPLTGTYTVPPSAKFIAADQNRLLMFGDYTSTNKQNRITISAVVGSLNVGDAERVDTTGNYFIDLDENDSGIAMGIIGPVFGNFYAFKDRQFWELTPTGATASPYRQTALSKDIGLVAPKAATRGEDASGNSALYWMSHAGVYRYGVNGLEYIGRPIEDLILGPTATMNLGASHVVAHALYVAQKRQVWFWHATGSSNDPDTLTVYDVVHQGWSRFTGIAAARCSCLFSTTVAASMSRDVKPYIGSSTTANTILKCDADGITADSSVPFQSYAVVKPLEPGGPGFRGEVKDAILLATAGTGVTITALVIPDFDASLAKTAMADLTPKRSETRVSVRLEDSRLGKCRFVQYLVGDGAPTATAWTIDRLIVPYVKHEIDGV